MADIVTLTVNPSIDVSASVERVAPSISCDASLNAATPAEAASTWLVS